MMNDPYAKFNNQGQNMNQNNFEYMKYVDYYNPIVVQNYYAMLSQMNPMNFNSYFTQPYTMQNNRQRNFNMNYTQQQAPKQPLDEEVQKWINSRKRNFPTKNKIEEKTTIGKIKEDAGMLSKLELKLREKIKIISKFDKGGNFKQNKVRRNKRPRRKKQRKNEEPEDGEILDTPAEDAEKGERPEKPEKPLRTEKKEKPQQKQRRYFRYRRSRLYEEMIKPDKYKELNIILQSFRYFINEKLI